MMLVYAVFTFVVLMLGARQILYLFVDPSETEILKDAILYVHVTAVFFPLVGILCILRYSIQGLYGGLLWRFDCLAGCRFILGSRFLLCV